MRTVKRLFFKRYDSSGKFPDGRVKLDVHFTDSEGNSYVWTPPWEKAIRQFFLEAYRIETLNKPESSELAKFHGIAEQFLQESGADRPINYKFVATKIGDGLKYETTIGEINRLASALFPFDVIPHPNPAMTSSRSLAIYDWIMTLANQPLSDTRKRELIQQLVDGLAPQGSTLRKFVEDL